MKAALEAARRNRPPAVLLLGVALAGGLTLAAVYLGVSQLSGVFQVSKIAAELGAQPATESALRSSFLNRGLVALALSIVPALAFLLTMRATSRDWRGRAFTLAVLAFVPMSFFASWVMFDVLGGVRVWP